MFSDEIYLRLSETVYRENYTIIDDYSQIILTDFTNENGYYNVGYFSCASVIKLDGNNLLYIGGTKVHHDGLISFGYYYGASDKIYLWKTKKENN